MDAVEVMATLLALLVLAIAVTIAVVFGGIVWWHALIFLCVYNFCTYTIRALKNMA